MLARIRSHFMRQPVAYLALFVALGGTSAYAANTIGSDDVIDDSLRSEDIKNGTLRGGDLATNTIGSTRIVDDTLTADDIKNGTIGASDVAANSLGGGRIADNSLKGADIDEGSLSGLKVSGYTVSIPPTDASIPPGKVTSNTAYCPIGTKVVGGGSHSFSHDVVTLSSWQEGTDRWVVKMKNNGTAEATFETQAICVNAE
jgi:hypothetical protein